MLAVRPGGTGEIPKNNVEWRFGGQAVPTRPSPLLIGDSIYMVNDSGVVSCLNALTGKSDLATPPRRKLLLVSDRRRRPDLHLQPGRE